MLRDKSKKHGILNLTWVEVEVTQSLMISLEARLQAKNNKRNKKSRSQKTTS